MASGWAPDGAVQEQIDASIEDAVRQARRGLHHHLESAKYCVECDIAITEARRKAIPGVQLCIFCQSALEERTVSSGGINRRGSKDSQLR